MRERRYNRRQREVKRRRCPFAPFPARPTPFPFRRMMPSLVCGVSLCGGSKSKVRPARASSAIDVGDVPSRPAYPRAPICTELLEAEREKVTKVTAGKMRWES